MPIDSDLRSIPGPEVVVMPSDPPKAAPIAAPTPAISSSAWKVRTPNCLCLANSWRMSDAGVMGYEPRKIGRWAWWAATMRPQARAVLPVTLV